MTTMYFICHLMISLPVEQGLPHSVFSNKVNSFSFPQYILGCGYTLHLLAPPWPP